jgi:hypothetical protein
MVLQFKTNNSPCMELPLRYAALQLLSYYTYTYM